MNISNDRYHHLLNKARNAKRSGHDAWAVQSTGEKVAVALVLNRADWLQGFGYTIAEAIERAGQEWVAMIPQVARQLAEEDDA
jgi:ribosomal protein S8